MKWQDAKKQLLNNEKIRKQYRKVDLAYEVGKMVSEARIARNLTQANLAKLVGTKQPSIARIERGSYLPSLTFLEKIANALDTQLLPPRFDVLTSPTYASTYDFRSLRQVILYNPSRQNSAVNHYKLNLEIAKEGVFNAA